MEREVSVKGIRECFDVTKGRKGRRIAVRVRTKMKRIIMEENATAAVIDPMKKTNQATKEDFIEVH